jgi:nucleoside-diphosphate-sugar epimerase
MKILVIGGTGFIGQFLVRDLIAQGHDVAVFHRGRTRGKIPAGVNEILGDQSELRPKRLDLRRVQADVVVDCILSSARQAKDVMQVFRGVTPRIVVLSSQDVYRAYGIILGIEEGPLQSLPLTEESEVRTHLRPYSAEHLKRMRAIFAWLDDEYEKIEVEEVVTNDPELPATVLRLPMVYGPGDPLHRLYPILKRIDDRRRGILLDQRVTHLHSPRGYVENVAAAITLAVASDKARDRIYNVAEQHAYSELEWTKLIGEVAGWEGEVIVSPSDETPVHLRAPFNTTQDWTVSSDRIREELGYKEPISGPEALRRTIEWERDNPPSDVSGMFDYDAEDAALARFKPTHAERHP